MRGAGDVGQRRLRWLLFADHVPADGRGGGMVRYVTELATALAARPDVELHLRVRAEAEAWWRQFVPAATTWPVAAWPAPIAALAERRGWRPLGPSAVDVVQGAKHLLPRLAGPAGPQPGARGAGAPVGGALRLLTVHDMLPLDRPGDFGILKRTLLPGPYLRSVLEADALLCVSAATRERLLSYMPAVRQRAHVVPLAPSTALLAARPTAVAGLVPGNFVLAVGDASQRKNLGVLTAAWPLVRRVVPGAVLAVAGPADWGASHLGEDAAQLVAEGALVRLGHLRDSELRWCYENAAAVAFPSSLEGFGLPAVEARALGAPLVHSDDPAICEAAAGYGRIEPDGDPRRWAAALSAALRDPGSCPRPPEMRRWAEVAADTVAAARAAGAGAGGAARAAGAGAGGAARAAGAGAGGAGMSGDEEDDRAITA